MRYSGLIMRLPFLILIYLIMHIARILFYFIMHIARSLLLSLSTVGCHHRGEYSRSDLSIPARYRIDYENPRAPARVAHWSWNILVLPSVGRISLLALEHFILPFGPRSVGARYQLPAHALMLCACIVRARAYARNCPAYESPSAVCAIAGEGYCVAPALIMRQ